MMPSKWPNKLIVLIVAAILFSVAAIFHFSKGDASSSNTQVSASKNSPEQSSTSSSNSSQVIVIKKSPLKDFIKAEVPRVGVIDPNPDETAKRLQDYAQKLTSAECGDLVEIILNTRKDADERLLSAYLLSEVAGPQGLSALEKLAMSPVPKRPNDRSTAEERGFRALAIEGLGRISDSNSRKILQDVASSQGDQFLVDRAQRALYGIEKGNPREAEKQDKDALEKVLQLPNK